MEKSAKTKFTISACVILAISMLLAGGTAEKTFAATSSASFGYAQIGTSSNSTFQGLYISNFTSPGDVGNITRIEIYTATGGCTAQAVIYSDDNGAPVALLYASSPENVEATTGNWISFNVNYTALPKFNYWIGVIFQSAATYYYTPSVNQTATFSASTTMATDLCPSGTTTPGSALSIYAVYAPTQKVTQGTPWFQTALFWIIIIGAILAIIFTAAFAANRRKTPSQHQSNSPMSPIFINQLTKPPILQKFQPTFSLYHRFRKDSKRSVFECEQLKTSI